MTRKMHLRNVIAWTIILEAVMGFNLHITKHPCRYDGTLEFKCCRMKVYTGMLEIRTNDSKILYITDFQEPIPRRNDTKYNYTMSFTTTTLCGTLAVYNVYDSKLTLKCHFNNSILSLTISACSKASVYENVVATPLAISRTRDIRASEVVLESLLVAVFIAKYVLQ